MKRQILFVFLALALMMALSVSAFAVSSEIDATSGDDITNAIAGAQVGDTVTVNLAGDITLTTKIAIEKAITVTINFNGYQINYTGSTSSDHAYAGLYVADAGAVLNLNGNNPLDSVKDYSHYGDDVKADMTGTSNLVVIVHGTLNMKDMYCYGSENAWVIHQPIVDNNDAQVSIENSVLRVPDGSSRSAITFRGANKSNSLLNKRLITVNDSVVYGGFKGTTTATKDQGSFNVTIGSSFTNVKFYDFAIENDSWYDPTNSAISPLLARSVEEAILFDGCVFQKYDGTQGGISVTTYTGKQNIKLLNCDYSGFTGTLGSDRGGQAYIFVVISNATCSAAGSATRYGSNFSTSTVAIAASGHNLGNTVMTFPNGYTNAGVGVAYCSICGEAVNTGDAYDALFTNLGYSAYESGDSITLGIMVNKDAYDKYVADVGELDFGIIAGNSALDVSVKDGKVSVTNGVFSSLTSFDVSIFNLKVIGIDDSKKDLKIAMEFYIFDGESVEFVDGTLDFYSFNDIIRLLDTVTQEAEALLESKHKLYYNDDGSFKVMTLSDLHMNVNGDATNVQEVKDRIKLLVDRENPDLIVLTGDNVIGAGSEAVLRADIDAIVSYIEEKQIPWCHVYGNHDREGGMSNEKQQPIFESYEYCISKTGPDITGVGNYVHGIYNKDGTLGAVIYFLDSGSSNSTYTYDYFAEDQIAWYKETSELLQEYNDGKLVYGMMAFHIPLIENRDAYNNRDNVTIVTEYTGNRNENICSTEYKDDQMFETIRQRGDVKAIVTGHDHVNDYMYNYYGVKLCSSPNISDLTYYNADVQGARVFDLNEKTVTNIPTYVSYIIERINPDDFGTYDKNIVIENFEGVAPTFVNTGYDSTALSGSVTTNIVDGKLVITRSATGNFEVNISFAKDKYGKLGENSYLKVYVDFTNVDFRKACFGILSSDGAVPYRTDDHDTSSPFYYLADGSDEWVEMKHGGDGCFGTAQYGSVKGLKGYLALPTQYFKQGSSAANADTLVTGIYFYGDISSTTYANCEFILDEFAFVDDYSQAE